MGHSLTRNCCIPPALSCQAMPFEARVNGSPSRDRTALEDSRPSILISPTPTSRELDLCLRPVFLHILR